jgi:hypothetical protein
MPCFWYGGYQKADCFAAFLMSASSRDRAFAKVAGHAAAKTLLHPFYEMVLAHSHVVLGERLS